MPTTITLPKLREVSNEIVFYLGLAISILNAIVVAISEVDFTSAVGILATVGPAFSGFTGRQFAFGAKTVERMNGNHTPQQPSER